MIQRNVLVVDDSGIVSDQLRQSGIKDIEFSYVKLVPQAKQLLHSKKIAVGLLVFDSHFLEKQEEIDQIISQTSLTDWIALANPEVFRLRECQSLVVRAFHDYHTLPFDLQRLLMSIGHALGRANLRESLSQRKKETNRFDICGASPVMASFFTRLDKVIHSDAPVLIGGETGTGKELVAQAIHKFSKRENGPMVVVNCGAIPINLIQSEFFGHEKGAFTGATHRHIGKIESAKGGVLFLDEIGDLPIDMQVSLLRVLQEHTISRVGSMHMIPVDFRVIAATHVNLNDAISSGRFREDLYYRLNVLHLDVPPLRDRGDDIILLAETVFEKYSDKSNNSPVKGFSKESLKVMTTYDWPGNVRELISRVQRAMVMSENRLLSPADLGLDQLGQKSKPPTLDKARASFDRDMLESSLRKNGYIVAQAARQLGVSRVTLYRMMNKLSIAQTQ